MTIELGKYPEFLERVASEIDIPPGKYQNAVDRYEAVGRWLEAGGYPGGLGTTQHLPTRLLPPRDSRQADSPWHRGRL